MREKERKINSQHRRNLLIQKNWKIETRRIEHVLKHDVKSITCCETWRTQSVMELIFRITKEHMNENLIEFITKIIRTNNLSSNQNLIVGVVEPLSREKWLLLSLSRPPMQRVMNETLKPQTWAFKLFK